MLIRSTLCAIRERPVSKKYGINISHGKIKESKPQRIKINRERALDMTRLMVTNAILMM